MIQDAAPERLTMPVLAAPPPRTPFPFVATAAPVLVSLGIWAVTGSVYSLLFAALGPVVALGSLLDGRRQRRRTRRRDTERALGALGRTREHVRELQEIERARLVRLAPPLTELCLPSRVAANWAHDALDSDSPDAAPVPVRLGRAQRPSVAVVDGGAGGHEPDEDLPGPVRAALVELRRAAAGLPDAPWLADARDGIGIVGPLPAARALARSLVLQLAANCSPVSTRIAAVVATAIDEQWLAALPHAIEVVADGGACATFRLTGHGQGLLIACAPERSQLPPGVTVVVALGPGRAEDAPPNARFELLGVAQATDAANALAILAAERGLLAAARRLPDAVGLAEVLSASDDPTAAFARPDGGLSAPIGRDAAGVVELDLVRDGPHAVVAGTTGAGKSELLVSWVLAMAARHPPSAVTFLLVDFKGGAAFAPLAGLAHVIGTVSDLDARRSARAIESLRAELLRRERVLAERGVRSIDELVPQGEPGLARLVIVVDEFAAVVSGQPDLHELFADLSARGRSLGLHLILCTQRPSGVVRDAVLANVTLRVSLRVTDRGDSLAMLGTDAATRLPQAPRGRALIADGAGATREVQLALAEPGDAERLAVGGRPPLGTVWCDPLPEQLPLDALLLEARADGAAGIPFGRLDLPTEQRQPIALHDPRSDGHLLVLGAARSGRTTALATLAESAGHLGIPVSVVPPDPAEAWSILTELGGSEGSARPPDSEPGLVLLDDLDLLLNRVDPDARHELLELLTHLVRVSRLRSLIVTAQRLTGALQAFSGLFDARILFGQSSRDEYVIAGGDGAWFDSRLAAGSGRWTGRRGTGAVIQLARGREPLPPPDLVELPVIRPLAGHPLAVVHPQARQLAPRWVEEGIRVVLLGEGPVPADDELRAVAARPLVLVGDPDAWQAEWALLGMVRREMPLVAVGCTPAELRSLARVRDGIPLLGSRPGECWLVEAGNVRRAILDATRSTPS